MDKINHIVRFDTSPWKLTQEEFNYYTPKNDGVVEGYEFYVNKGIRKCDFWVIRGSIQSNCTLIKCPKGNVIYLMDEAYELAEFPVLFLKQFAQVIGPKNVDHRNYVRHNEMFPWLFLNKPYSGLIQNLTLTKSKEICIIVSDATWLQGHKDRFAFVNKLIGHFKDRIDIYGRGFNSFECKYEILKKYKYSICIENSSLPDYFTEKINECYLAEVFPIYFGCTNIQEYYDSNSFLSIDIYDYQKSIEKIEYALQSSLWENNIDLIRQMKHLYLTKYHLPIGLVALLRCRDSNIKRNWNVVINRKFYSQLDLSFQMLKNGLVQVVSKVFVLGISRMTKGK
jgi:hypothetical protein